MKQAKERHPVDLLAFCLMPNHFHLVVRVERAAELSAMMQWWLTSHVRRYHRCHATTGHVWQGRYKSFPIQADEHLLTVLRYVLLNPCRARLVEDPWAWRWSSLWFDPVLAAWPVEPPGGLRTWLKQGLERPELEQVRHSIVRGTPFGDEAWQAQAAADWGLEATIRPRGRPRSELIRSI